MYFSHRTALSSLKAAHPVVGVLKMEISVASPFALMIFLHAIMTKKKWSLMFQLKTAVAVVLRKNASEWMVTAFSSFFDCMLK